MAPTNILFLSLVILAIIQRALELRRSRLNHATLWSNGYRRVDSPASYVIMVSVHTLWFIAMLVEHTVSPQTLPVFVTTIALMVFLCAQILRLAVMRALGSQWNTKVMAPTREGSDPGVVTSGPYRYIRHPNYLAVILEFVSLPLIGGALYTALVSSVANGLLLRNRIRAEEQCLFTRPGYYQAFSKLPRLFPHFLRPR